VGQIVSAFTICCNFTVAEVYIFLFVFWFLTLFSALNGN
jgi:hypothetical protein